MPVASKIFEAFVFVGIFATFIAAVFRVEKCYCYGFFQKCTCLAATEVPGLSEIEQSILEVKGEALKWFGWTAIAVFGVEFLVRLGARGPIVYCTSMGELWRFACLGKSNSGKFGNFGRYLRSLPQVPLPRGRFLPTISNRRSQSSTCHSYESWSSRQSVIAFRCLPLCELSR